MKQRTRWLTGLVAISTLAGCSKQGMPTENTTRAVSASAWRELAKLPDWSGAWIIDSSKSSFSLLEMGRRFDDKANWTFNTEDDSPVGKVPFTPKYKKALAANIAHNGGHGLNGTRLAHCLPPGLPGLLEHGTAFEFLFTPGRVTMIFQDGEVRRIFTDGRSHPNRDEMQDSVLGHSIGHWEGDTLVVDTVNLAPQAELFFDGGFTVTPNTHISERIHKKDTNSLQIDFVVTDPEIYTAPYAYTRLYQRSGLETFETQCEHNNRDTGESIDLTPPPIDESGGQS